MWSILANGYVSWSDPARLRFIEFIKRNPILSSKEKARIEKTKAWTKIQKELVGLGMPKRVSTSRLQHIWSELRLETQQKHANKQGLSQVDHAIIDVLKNGQRRLERSKIAVQMPVPIGDIKQEPTENAADETMIETAEDTAPMQNMNIINDTFNMNPIVLLERIEKKSDMPIAPGPMNYDPRPRPSKASDEYWYLMKKIAETDLKLKLKQMQEDEIESEIRRKKLLLLDLQIQEQELQNKALMQSQTRCASSRQ